MSFSRQKINRDHSGADHFAVLYRILPKLPYIFLITIFFLLHCNVLFRGYYRPHGDYTPLHFSIFYFLDGIFFDGELPLWQPYRHLGTMNLNALLSFNPLLVILSRLFLCIGEIIGMKSSSMYQVTFLSYMTGYILTFVLPIGLLAREVIKNISVRWIAVGAALFGSHIFLMISLGQDILFYFPFTILFWTRMIKDEDNSNIIANLSGLIISLSLTLSYTGHIITVYLAVAIAALLTSERISNLFIRLKSALSTCSKRNAALLAASFAVALGLCAIKLAVYFRVGDFDVKNRTVVKTKAAFLNILSDGYIYSNHIFSVFENFLNIFSYNNDILVKSGLQAPLLYFGVIAIFISILMFRQIQERRLFYFFLISAVFILICTTNPKNGYNFILPFSYLFNPIFAMGSRHVNLITLFAAPFVIMALCMALDSFVSRYSYVTYPRHHKIFIFLIISSLCAYLVYNNLVGYYPKIYIYWYIGVMSLVVSILLYFPRKQVFKSHIIIPVVLAVIIIVEMIIPLRDYTRYFYRPFPKNGGGYFGNSLPVKNPIRGWPVPMSHSFPDQFNAAAGLNTTNLFDYRINNAYFKFSSIESYDDSTFYEKGGNIEDMPWLKRFTERLFFVNNIIPVKERDEALCLTKMICETGKNSQYAVVERFPDTFFSKDISLLSANELDNISTIQGADKPLSLEFKAYTISKKDFKSIGADPDNAHALLYSAKLPEDFPRYLTTNYLNEDYKDITVVEKNGRAYTPTYFDLFQEPSRFQIGFRDYRRIVISSSGDAPEEIVIKWRDRLRERGIEIVKFSYNTLTLKTSTERDSFMVYMDRKTKRWKFYLDGIQKDIFTTNGIAKGVFVPKGTHTLVFKYSDPFFAASFAIYTFSLVAAWGLLVVFLRSGAIQKNDSCDNNK